MTNTQLKFTSQDQDDRASVSDAKNPVFTTSMYGKLMKRIHQTHKQGQSIRNVLLPVLLTDRRNYAAALAQFYFPTALLETILRKRQKHDPIIASIVALGTSFAAEYEHDLQQLLGKGWRAEVEAMCKPAAAEYVQKLQIADAEGDIVSLVAAYFILHGPLVVGGGPALKPFVQKAFGPDAVDVLDVKDRVEKKKRFKNFFNAGLQLESAKEEELLGKCASFMSLNNDLLTQLDLMPTSMAVWLPVVLVGTAVVAGTAYYFAKGSRSSATAA